MPGLYVVPLHTLSTIGAVIADAQVEHADQDMVTRYRCASGSSSDCHSRAACRVFLSGRHAVLLSGWVLASKRPLLDKHCMA
jgi:hypothetical protein